MAAPNAEIVETSNPGVKEVAKQWSVYEDGALAYQLQSEENTNHFSGNISRRRTVRTDREVAKVVAKESALEAFREEHEIAERNRQIEEEDRERARVLQLQILREEQEKALQERETDEMLARRLQIEEKQRMEAERRRRMEERQMEQDERLARRLSQQQNGHRHHPHSGKHKTKTDYVEDAMGEMRIADSRPSRGSHNRSSSSPAVAAAGGIEQPMTVAMDNKDSDEESDALAKLNYDENIARRMQKEEEERSRLSEQHHKQLLHDEKIARKMQHEEVMLAKKKTRNKYMNRVSAEVADPAPMVHVSKEKKVPVLADAKEGNGVTLTDISRPGEGQDSLQRSERSGESQGKSSGNILTAIDPTYQPQPGSGGNVVLTKKTPIGDFAPPQDSHPPPANGTSEENFGPIQGTKRSSTKEKKRGSIFSKLKKK
ncbi:uncharacterized protein [Diadema antillarum]|uniref:uncharacterized protein n=1 Tax=Diadema antillarum TaxID=105358 RepID=UPI003A84075A